MPEDAWSEVSLVTLHQDLGDLKQDLGEVKALIAVGLRALPPPEWPGEVVRLLREMNRLSEERSANLDALVRQQALETHGILRALAESQRQVVETQWQLVEGQRQLVEGQRQLVEGQRSLSEDIRALIARIDALIKGREDGSPSRS
jgi:hypothetical protein